jgi:hypothetical protein
MEEVKAGVPQCDEGSGTGEVNLPANSARGCYPAKYILSEEQDTGQTAPSAPVTPQTMRQLRGQYFTVRHIPLADCGHKMDVINEPRHRNCENCWWQWLNFHPQLVQTVNEAWQEHGKAFVIRLRGEHFAKMFGRYMASVRHFMEEEKRNGNDRQAAGTEGGGKEVLGAVTTTDQSGEDQSSAVSGEVAQ